MGSGKLNKPMVSSNRVHSSKKHRLLAFLLVVGLLCYDYMESNVLYGRIVANTASKKRLLKEVKKKVIVNYEREFPYDLNCPYFELPSDSNITIALAYHVGMVNNWENVVNDQLNTLSACGLGYAAKDLLLSYTGNKESSPDKILELMKPYGFSLTLQRILEPKRIPWEGDIMNALQEYCTDKPDAIVFYFHTKGVSRYTSDWRNQTGKHAYVYSLYWRKILEYFTIEHPAICINKILGNYRDNKNDTASEAAAACSAIMGFSPSPHYSGNMWVASCKHLRNLPQINFDAPLSKQQRYVSAEMWIGGNYDSQKFINLWQPPPLSWLGLYENSIKPEDYWLPEDLVKLKK